MTDSEREWLSQQFDRCWPYLHAAIVKMNERYGRDFVEQQVMNGEAQLWPGSDCAIVTRIECHQDGTKELFGWLAGGNRREIESIQPKIEAWAKRSGCTRVRTIQRLGFMRKPLHGYRPTAVIMEKEI